MTTYNRNVDTLAHAQMVVGELLKSSRWFALMPMPGDVYQVSVKNENKDWLDVLIRDTLIGGLPFDTFEKERMAEEAGWVCFGEVIQSDFTNTEREDPEGGVICTQGPRRVLRLYQNRETRKLAIVLQSTPMPAAEAVYTICEEVPSPADEKRIIITLDGGLVEEIYATEKCRVAVVDFDTEDAPDEDLVCVDDDRNGGRLGAFVSFRDANPIEDVKGSVLAKLIAKAGS